MDYVLNQKNLYANVRIDVTPPPLFAYLHIFIVLTGWFNFCRFFQPWFFCSDGKNRVCFLVWVWIRVQFVDNARYSLSSQQSQINLINPKLLLCYSWSLVEGQFFFNWVSLHTGLKSHYEGWSYKKQKTIKIIDENV